MVPEPAGKSSRIVSIDMLRGIIMVLMALDHARDYFSSAVLDIMNAQTIDPLLFFTRWITDFCAPGFVFLAGTAAFFYGANKRKSELSRFLISRGIWLIFLEFTLVYFGWTFNLNFSDGYSPVLQVIWAIGWSMIFLAAMVYLPKKMIAAIGIIMIFGHNLLDGIQAESLGNFAWLWNVIHQPGILDLGRNFHPFLLYSLVPWVGVMAAGYAFGDVMKMGPIARKKVLLWLGLGLTLAFVIVRWTNIYGDPDPWAVHTSGLLTLDSFIDCCKYPPSLLFLMMTLGPSFLLLSFLERDELGKISGPLVTIGRVPMFYYLLHLPLIHGLAFIFALIKYNGHAPWMHTGFVMYLDVVPFPGAPADYGYGLGVVYLVWIAVVLALYPLCRFWAGIKQRHKDWWWLSYL